MKEIESRNYDQFLITDETCKTSVEWLTRFAGDEETWRDSVAPIKVLDNGDGQHFLILNGNQTVGVGKAYGLPISAEIIETDKELVAFQRKGVVYQFPTIERARRSLKSRHERLKKQT